MNNLEYWGEAPDLSQFSNLSQILNNQLRQDSSVSFFFFFFLKLNKAQ